jgi:tetratricopeptide (TPR) repeat protein
MSTDQAYIADTKALRTLADATARLHSHIGRTIELIETDAGPRLRRLKLAAQSAREDVRRAEEAYYEACREEDGDVSGTLAALEEAQERLTRIERAIDYVQAALRKYKAAARDLADSRRGLLTGAAAYLAERMRAVDTYLALQLDPGAAASSSGSSMAANSAGAASDGLSVDAMNGVDLPEGFRWIPISEIVERDLPSSSSEWKKGVSKEDMRTGLNAFRRDMLPALARRGHISRDDFVSLDRALGRASRGVIEPDSVAHLYDVFFGIDAIAIDRNPGGGFSITNGRHRVVVARELGWTHVPARLLGRSGP